MAYQLHIINEAVRRDAAGFMAECDRAYQDKVSEAAARIIENMAHSPVVLLSGPSGSGKTTTAAFVEKALERRGVEAHTISLDDYYVRVDPENIPLTPDGSVDYESPQLLDLALLREHFTRLGRGEEVMIPRFDFTRQTRAEGEGRPLRLGKDEVAIFEGIHALNDAVAGGHPEAARMYVTAREEIFDGDALLIQRTWTRLLRRIVRDNSFRGADAGWTLGVWGNVRRGEGLYISPFKGTAHITLVSSLPYELPVLAGVAAPLLEAAPPAAPLREELLTALARFEPIDPAQVPKLSLLREFIGY